VKSLSDVVSGAGLERYAEIALLLFFAVFVAVTLRVLFSNEETLDRAARMPLSDDSFDAKGATNDDR
jgi:hypothetical protein